MKVERKTTSVKVKSCRKNNKIAERVKKKWIITRKDEVRRYGDGGFKVNIEKNGRKKRKK